MHNLCVGKGPRTSVDLLLKNIDSVKKNDQLPALK